MRKLLLAALILLAAPHANAKEYGHYDLLNGLFTTSLPADGKQAGAAKEEGKPSGDQQHALDVAYLDQVINDLAIHAKNYPPRFDTPQDKERAVKDTTELAGILDILLQTRNDPEFLLRAALVNSIGYNLDIPGTGTKANALFLRVLEVAPDHPGANYAFGAFLGGAGRPLDALPYLERALALGAPDAAYGLGFTYLSLGNKEQALKYLEQYRASTPGANIDELIQAIKDGKIEMKRGKG